MVGLTGMFGNTEEEQWQGLLKGCYVILKEGMEGLTGIEGYTARGYWYDLQGCLGPT